jgi:hypothetical protein
MGFPWISECWGSSISRCCNIYFFAWFLKGFLLFLLGLWVGLDPTSNSKDILQRHHSRSWQYPHQNCAFGRRYSRKHQWHYSSSAGRKQHVTRMRFCVVRNLHWSAWMLFELASPRWVWRSACTLEQSWAIHSSPGQGPTPSSFCQKDSSWIGFIMIYWYLLSLHCLYSSGTFVLFAQPSKQRVGGNKLGFEGPGAARKSHPAVGASRTDGHQGWLQGSGREHHTAP